MIDTVHFDQRRALLPSTVIEGRRDWILQRRTYSRSAPRGRFCVVLENPDTGIHLFGSEEGCIDRVHIPSLPALLYGHNAVGLESQQDVDHALAVVELILEQVTERSVGPGVARSYRRVDIAIQLPVAYWELELALSYARQPGARKGPRIHRGESLVLPLADHDIALYDKPAQLGARRHTRPAIRRLSRRMGPVTRMELRLCGRRLSRALGDPPGSPVTRLDYARLWPAMRDAFRSLIGTRPIEASPIRTREALMAELALANPDLYERRLAALSPDRRRKTARCVERATPALALPALGLDRTLLGDDPPRSLRIELPGFCPRYPELVQRARIAMFSRN